VPEIRIERLGFTMTSMASMLREYGGDASEIANVILQVNSSETVKGVVM
jgi:hypothetical protein